jgi:uncharacterized GH25 family protein
MYGFVKNISGVALKIVLVLPLLFAATAPLAHDFWVEPDSYKPVIGERVEIRLREGVEFKGDTLPYIPEWFKDFSSVDIDGRNPVVSRMGDDPAATLVAKEGALLVGYRSNRSYVELDAAKFNSYLEDEGIEFIREQRIAAGEDDQPAPEYFVRCAKVLVHSGADGAAVFKTELGYILELIAIDDPQTLAAGDDMRFQLKYRGEPVENLLVQAFTRAEPGEKQKVRTDADGMATIKLTEPGVWMVKAVNIQPIIGDPKAKWQSYWASYLFELLPTEL